MSALLERERLRLRAYGGEWLLDAGISDKEAEQILVYLDAYESEQEAKRPSRLGSTRWWISFVAASTPRFHPVIRGRATMRGLMPDGITGYSLQRLWRRPIEHRFAGTSVIEGPVRAQVSEGAATFQGVFFADADVLQLLEEVDAERVPLEAVGQVWDEIYDGLPEFRIAAGRWAGIRIRIFKDAGEWDYVDAIYDDYGRTVRPGLDAWLLDWDTTNLAVWEDAPLSAYGA